MKKEQENGAVLYIRVSTDDQASGPLNLNNQEKRCRDFCKQHGWPVVTVFVDAGESARTIGRPEFKKMLAFCKTHRRQVRYVVVQDLSRFARNVEDQARVMADLLDNQVLVRSATETNVDESANGKLSASLVGSFNEYFSNSLAEKMRVRTRDSASAGRFPWRAPLGYVNTGSKIGANIKPDAERAPFIRRAFELIASGDYRKTQVLDVLNRDGLRTLRGELLTAQTLQAILRNPLYAGWVTLPSDKAFKPVLGLHEAIVSQETFDLVQSVLDGKKPTAILRKKFNAEFPLKCIVRCAACNTPLTGAFCKGRNKKYARYWCRNSQCRGVKLAREKLEMEFVELLRQLRPNANTIAQFSALAARAWTEREGNSTREIKRLSLRLEEQKTLKRKLLAAFLAEKVSESEYADANQEFSIEISLMEQELQSIETKQGNGEGFLRFAELHILDIAQAWQIANPESRQKVQNLLFENGLHYSAEHGILNRPKSSLFNALHAMTVGKGLLASPTGFEPVLSP